MANCFIVMPITTPETLVSAYGSDREHFHHVLEHLFVPAVEKAGLTAIRPLAQGADVIHAEIIKNIEQADVVLCDISSLNANVFFELGIRTALNKPVCVVKDELTNKIPFDTGIINHHTYASALAPWTLDKDVAALSAHLKSSVERSSGQNPLWRYFGITRPAELPDKPHNVSEQIDLLRLQIEGMNRKLDERDKQPSRVASESAFSEEIQEAFRLSHLERELHKWLRSFGIPFESTRWNRTSEFWEVVLKDPPHPTETINIWKRAMDDTGLSVCFLIPKS
jgi:hypothetical protein